MTARLPGEPVRVTNWLAGWLDYVCATVISAGRWFRLPLARGGDEPVMMAAFAPTMDAYAPHWHEADDDEGSGRLVRILEIAMLSISFFLAAHLLSGGTPTVSAPDLNPFQVGSNRAQAAALAIPGASGKQIVVNAGNFSSGAPAAAMEPSTPVDDAALAAAVQAQAPATDESAVLGPPSQPGADAAAVPTPAPQPVASAPEASAPPPAPAAASPAPGAANDRYLSKDELRAAAIAAGWPAELLPELEVVAWCESRYHTHAEYFGALGLMQMMPSWFEDAGLNIDLWWDPVVNLKAAWHAYETTVRLGIDGWGPWTCKP